MRVAPQCCGRGGIASLQQQALVPRQGPRQPLRAISDLGFVWSFCAELLRVFERCRAGLETSIACACTRACTHAHCASASCVCATTRVSSREGQGVAAF